MEEEARRRGPDVIHESSNEEQRSDRLFQWPQGTSAALLSQLSFPFLKRQHKIRFLFLEGGRATAQ